MLMDSPRVVSPKWGVSETARWGGLLKKLDRRGSRLHRAVRNAEARRLGDYFETLMRTWIEEVPPAKLAAANWQVYSGPRTIGEFDLLFRRDRRLWHWELAIKFYLGHPAEDGQFRWFGPKPRDRLDRKWAKMRGQQLRLKDHPASEVALDILGVDDEPQPRAFIKGYLFEPLDAGYEVEYPPDINPRALRGWWVHHNRLKAHRSRLEAEEWVILEERRWMSPARPTDEDRLMSFDALTGVVPPHRPTLVAGLDDGHEVTRGFVVPRNWPYFSR